MNHATGKLSKRERITARQELCKAVRTSPEAAKLLEVGQKYSFDLADEGVCMFVSGPVRSSVSERARLPRATHHVASQESQSRDRTGLVRGGVVNSTITEMSLFLMMLVVAACGLSYCSREASVQRCQEQAIAKGVDYAECRQ